MMLSERIRRKFSEQDSGRLLSGLLDSRWNFVFTRNRAPQAPAGSREGLSPLSP